MQYMSHPPVPWERLVLARIVTMLAVYFGAPLIIAAS
jgi:hypothetical protein